MSDGTYQVEGDIILSSDYDELTSYGDDSIEALISTAQGYAIGRAIDNGAMPTVGYDEVDVLELRVYQDDGAIRYSFVCEVPADGPEVSDAA